MIGISLNMMKIQQLLVILVSLMLKKSTSQETSVDTDDFQSLLLDDDVPFVDKSLFIRDFVETNPSSLLIVRPSGWGKSINMDMLRRFFQPEVDPKGNVVDKCETMNGKLFRGGLINLHSNQTKYLGALQICKVSGPIQKMGKHPVIFLKMKDTSGNSYEEIMYKIKTRIKEAFEDHRYLLNSSRVSFAQELGKYFGPVEKYEEKDLHNCLYFLGWKLFQHFGQTVIALIDDYDAPIINAYLRFGAKSQEFKKVLELMKNLYRTMLSFNSNLFKGLLCGSLKISLTNDTSSMLDINTLMNPKFYDFFGFTHNEVIKLIHEAPSSELLDVTGMRNWYGRYKHNPNQNMFVYNSRSIIKCIKNNGTLKYYGQDSNQSTGLVDKLLSTDIIQPKIHELVSGKGLDFVNFIHLGSIRWERISILEVLYLNGYIRPMKVSFEDNQRLIIPNKEMFFFFGTKVLQWVSDKLTIDVPRFCSLAETLPKADIEGFEKGLQKYLPNAASYIQKLDDEAKEFYVGLMIALQRALASSHFVLMKELKRDFSIHNELLLVPKPGQGDTAIAINYKTAVSAMETMAKASISEITISCYKNQMMSRGHTHIGKLIKVGVAFCREKMLVRYEIENITSYS